MSCGAWRKNIGERCCAAKVAKGGATRGANGEFIDGLVCDSATSCSRDSVNFVAPFNIPLKNCWRWIQTKMIYRRANLFFYKRSRIFFKWLRAFFRQLFSFSIKTWQACTKKVRNSAFSNQHFLTFFISSEYNWKQKQQMKSWLSICS